MLDSFDRFDTRSDGDLSPEVADRLIRQTLDAFIFEGVTFHQARQVLDRVKLLAEGCELIAGNSELHRHPPNPQRGPSDESIDTSVSHDILP
jgi:hypothetical protein